MQRYAAYRLNCHELYKKSLQPSKSAPCSESCSMKTATLAVHEPAAPEVAGNVFRKHCHYSATGLDIDEDTSFQDWQVIGDFLKFLDGSIQWIIGDWVAFGEKRYGDQYTAAMQATGMAYKTVANALWVAKRIPKERRRPSLTFSHHMRVAALPMRKQEALLNRAVKEGLGVTAVYKLAHQESHAGAEKLPTLLVATQAAAVLETFLASPAFPCVATEPKRMLLEVVIRICSLAAA